MPRERPLLALQDVDLGFHDGGALGEGHELRAEVADVGTARVRRHRRELLGRGRAPGLVPGGLRASLGDEHVDLGDLVLEIGDLAPDALVDRGEVEGHLGSQSSGIRIQPCRIAYTTAWVRSLTDSFRRIELMWFLTVCSLIDSA